MSRAVNLEQVDQAVGERLERLVVAHHRRRLGRVELEARAGRAARRLGGRRPAAAAGEPLGRARRRRRGAARDRPRRSRRHARASGSPAGTSRPSSSSGGQDAARPPRRDRRAGGRARPRLGGRPAAALPPVRAARCARCATGSSRHADPLSRSTSRERPMHCHHEKLVVVDGERRVRRRDRPDLARRRPPRRATHPASGELGWHDAAARIAGPAVADVADHFRLRWHEIAGERLPRSSRAAARPAASSCRSCARCRSGVYDALPRGDFRILECLPARPPLGRAADLPREPVPLVARARRGARGQAARPAERRLPPRGRAPGARQTTAGRHARPARRARRGRRRRGPLPRVHALPARAPAAEPVYVHAKIGIVDDRWLTVGSANLNEHSLFNDTEMNVVTQDAALARATRAARSGRSTSNADPAEVDGDPAQIVDERWRPLARSSSSARRRDGHAHAQAAAAARTSRAARRASSGR